MKPLNSSSFDRFGLGGNNPPEPLTPEQVTTVLTFLYAKEVARRDELVRACEAFLAKYPVIESEDVAGAAAENMEMIRKHRKRIEDSFKEAKAPYLEGGRAIDAWFNGLRTTLTEASDRIGKPAAAWALKVRERREAASRAEAEHRQREADAASAIARKAAQDGMGSILTGSLYGVAIATAKAAEAAASGVYDTAANTRQTGIYGSTSTLKEAWEIEVIDAALIPRQFLTVDLPALKRSEGHGPARDGPGYRVFPAHSIRTRS